MVEINPTDPSQVSYPWRAALRTGVQTFVAALLALTAVAPLVIDFIESTWPGSPVVAWVTVGAAFAGALSVLITRVMALEAVNRLFTRMGIGATPKK
jgi:hypothetical protein